MKRDEAKSVAVHVRLPTDLLGLIERDARRVRLSVSGWIRLKLAELYQKELGDMPAEDKPGR